MARDGHQRASPWRPPPGLKLEVETKLPARDLYRHGAFGRVDHDQGQIAMKLMGFERGITILAGLPVPIVTPAHGSAFYIAGQGIARVDGLRQAYLNACGMAQARAGRM